MPCQTIPSLWYLEDGAKDDPHPRDLDTLPLRGMALSYIPAYLCPRRARDHLQRHPFPCVRPQRAWRGLRARPSHRPHFLHELDSDPVTLSVRDLILTCSADTAPFPVLFPLLLLTRPPLSAIFATCKLSGLRTPSASHPVW